MGVTTSIDSALREALLRLSNLSSTPIKPVLAILSGDERVAATTDPPTIASLQIVARAVLSFFADDWQPRDAAITNDPFHGSIHVTEFTLVRAMEEGGVVSRMRVPDIGGMHFGGLSRDVFDTWGEGARFTPVKIAVEGTPRRQALELLSLNSRAPTLLLRYLEAMSAEADRISESLERGEVALPSADSTSEALTDAIAALAPGTYSANDTVEMPGTAQAPVVRLRLLVEEDRLQFDFRESDGQVDEPINTTKAHTIDCCVGALMDAFPDYIPTSRSLEMLSFQWQDGTITAAQLPATTGFSVYVTARAIRRAALTALRDAGAAVSDTDRWWQEEGKRAFEGYVDPGTFRQHPEFVREIRELERVTERIPGWP